MFRNLSTSTKLLVLCGLFIISLAVTTYSLVTEKQIAIEFARKELIGSQYIANLRSIYEATLARQGGQNIPTYDRALADELIRVVSSREADAAGALQSAELEQALLKALRDLPSTPAEGADDDDPALDVLAKARSLILRAGDNSNLTLDPDLDTYYLQTVLVTKLPAWLGQLAQMRASFGRSASAVTSGEANRVRFQVLESALHSLLEGIRDDLKAAMRGNSDESLKQAADGPVETAIAASRSYLDALSAGLILSLIHI